MSNGKICYGCEKKVAVISGGTSGIGLAVAQKLAAEGARIYLLGRDAARGAAAVAKIAQQFDAYVKYISCDVRDADATEKAAVEIAAAAGCIDILINSAGVFAEQGIADFTEAEYARIMDTNVKGVLLLVQACLPLLGEGSAIVNVGSDAGVRANRNCPLYCASKGAVVALTRALALDLAPKIRVNCVCPADVDTPLLSAQLAATKNNYSAQDLARAYPLARIASAEEIAHVICALASPANSFMTGSIVCADGGLTA